ncbi:hypothetical protein VVR12_07395 [Rothia sp. LK2588]|uniref:hypothetical protein n=1 Tax=Rothia sp. LK2588 TaxID=3114369 RepID=UPI0034CD7CDA
MQKSNVKTNATSLFAAVLAVAGIATASIASMWLTGTLGVSTATATSIANAVEVGSWAMFLASIAATGGLVGAAMWGALKLMLKNAGKAAVVA